LNIGEELRKIIEPVLNAEKDVTGKRIRLSDYRANISKTAFTSGVHLDFLIEDILKKCK
jgi:hypothetical protein